MSTFPNHYSQMNANNAPLHYPVKPVGIFWDIENCPVPKLNNASSVIHFIRSFFVVNRLHHREFDFLVACDVTRINKTISDDINKAGGVTLAHVNGNSKNAADEQLRASMRKFVDTHGSATPTLVLISGDIDFVSDLRGYQTRLGCSIIVIHGVNSSQHFKTGWNEIYSFDTFLMMMGGTASPSLVAPAKGKQGPTKANNFQKPQNNNGQRQQTPNQGSYQGRQNQGNDKKKKIDSNQTTFIPKADDKHTKGQGPLGMDRKKDVNKPSFCGAHANNAIAGGSSGSGNAPFQKKKFPQKQRENTADEGFVLLDQTSLGNPPPKQQNEPKEKKEFLLMVTGLPGRIDYHILKDNLQKKASQVKGSVKFVKNGQGFISFKKKEHADNAIALFNGMEVFGKKLNVNYCQKIPFENRNNQEAGKQDVSNLDDLVKVDNAIGVKVYDKNLSANYGQKIPFDNRNKRESSNQDDANLDDLVKTVGEGIGTLLAKQKNSECCIQ